MPRKKAENTEKQETKEKAEKPKVEENKVQEKKPENRPLYLIDYYIKDLTIDKIIETNLEDYRKQSYAVVFHKDQKAVLSGLRSVFPKVDDALSKMQIGEQKTLKLTPEDAYGKRNKDLLKIVPFAVFKQNNIRPIVGLTIETNGAYGTIRSVSGGRVMVDFNSPYADHDIEFYFKLVKKPEGKEKIEPIIKALMPSVQIKELKYDETKKSVDLSIDKGKYNPEQVKGLEQIIQGILKPYTSVEKVTIVLS